MITEIENATPGWQIGDLVDLERYPLDRPGTDEYRCCVESVRHSLQTECCAVLGDFIRAERIDVLRAEAVELKPQAVYRQHQHNPYFTQIPDDLPADDPRSFRAGRTNGMVPADRFARNGSLWQLYTSEALRGFLADCLGLAQIHCYEDPYGCLILSVQQDGEEFTWHFDTMEFAVTLLLQEPESGGQFEYAPDIRSATDEHFAEVAEVLAGRSAATRRLDLNAGDLQLFRGRYSLHRVSRVDGGIARLIAVLAYNREAGVYATPERSLQAWGKIHPLQIEAERKRRRVDALLD